MLCPCHKYKNTKFARSRTVCKHLVNRGFTLYYYIWFHFREDDSTNEISSSSHFENVGNREKLSHLHYDSYPEEDPKIEHDRIHHMVTYAFHKTTSKVVAEVENIEEPNLNGKRFMKC